MRFNVLHLIADDLRTSIGAYGHTDAAKTPHLDRLAAQGVVFENAYSQIAVCTPSRNSFMTGRNPDTTGVYNDAIGYPDFRASPRGHHWTTLPGHFAKHGYFVTGLGKTYHPQSPADDDVAGGSWSDLDQFPYYRPKASADGMVSGCDEKTIHQAETCAEDAAHPDSDRCEEGGKRRGGTRSPPKWEAPPTPAPADEGQWGEDEPVVID